MDEKRYKEIAPKLSNAIPLATIQKVKKPKPGEPKEIALTKAKVQAVFNEFKNMSMTGEPVKPLNKIAADTKVPFKVVVKLWHEFRAVISEIEIENAPVEPIEEPESKGGTVVPKG